MKNKIIISHANNVHFDVFQKFCKNIITSQIIFNKKQIQKTCNMFSIKNGLEMGLTYVIEKVVLEIIMDFFVSFSTLLNELFCCKVC